MTFAPENYVEPETINAADLDWSDPYTLAVTYYCFAKFVPEGQIIEQTDQDTIHVEGQGILWKDTLEKITVGEGGAYEFHDASDYVEAVPAAEFEQEGWQPTELPGQWSVTKKYTAIPVTKDFELVVGDFEGRPVSWPLSKGDFVLRDADGNYPSFGMGGFATKVEVLAAPKP